MCFLGGEFYHFNVRVINLLVDCSCVLEDYSPHVPIFTKIRVISKAAMIMCVLFPTNSESWHHCHLFLELCCVYVKISGSEKLFIEDGALQLKQGHRFPSGSTITSVFRHPSGTSSVKQHH